MARPPALTAERRRSPAALFLDLNNLATPTNIVNSSSHVVLNAGSLAVIDKFGTTATSQTVAGVTLNAGSSTISAYTFGNTNGSSVLALGAIGRTVGGAVDFTLPAVGSITTSTSNTSGGILGGWATVGHTTWAVSAGPGAISGLTAYQTDTFGSGADVTIAANDTPGATFNINSLRFNNPAADSVTLAAGTSTIASGGILVTSNVAANTSTIAGGSLTSGAAIHELIVSQYNPSGSLAISSAIVDNGALTLTKLGPGALALSGNSSYSGGTTIYAGSLAVSSNNALGGSSAGAVTVNSGAELDLQGTITVPALSGANTTTISGAGLSGGAIDNLGGTNIYGGGVTRSPATTVGSASGSLTLGAINTTAAGNQLTLAGAGTVAVGGMNLGLARNQRDRFRRRAERHQRHQHHRGRQPIDVHRLWQCRRQRRNEPGRLATTVNSSGGGLTLGGSISNGANTLTIAGTSNVTLGGVVGNGSGGLTYSGTGTLTVNGSSNQTYTGATTVNTGGTMVVDLSNLATPTNMINFNSPLAMGGGTLTVKDPSGGAVATQTFASLTLHAGTAVIGVNANGNSNTGSSLALNLITVLAGGSADFTVPTTVPNTGNVTTTTQTYNESQSGTLGGWATANGGTSWAALTGSGPTFSIIPLPLSSYRVDTSPPLFGSPYYHSRITLPTDATPTQFSDDSADIAFANSANNSTVTLNNDFTLTSGGLLVLPLMGAHNAVIADGSGSFTGVLHAGAYLYVQQWDPSGTLTIAKPIAADASASGDTALVKTGPGTLILTAVNKYDGGSYLNQGTVNINADAALGPAPGLPTINLTFTGSATLQFTPGFGAAVEQSRT